MGDNSTSKPNHRLKYVGVGGTFDILHAGHKALLRAALRIGQRIGIGLASDELVKQLRKTHKVNSYDVRAEGIRRFLRGERALARAEIVPINDPYGSAIRDSEMDGLVVNRETLPTAREINRIRRKSGLLQLKLVVVEPVLAQDGKPISTRRIRSGQITQSGRVARISRSSKKDP
jgi:cytidyltransferase-like protein